MWVWLLLKFVAIIIMVSGALTAIALIGYSVWSLFQPKTESTPEETKTRRQKYKAAGHPLAVYLHICYQRLADYICPPPLGTNRTSEPLT